MVARAGLVVMGAGIGLLGYLAWMLWGTGMQTAASQRILSEQWAERGTVQPATEGPARPDEGIALLQLPAHVADSPLVVLDGVGEQALRRGPGRYPGSEDLGRSGNFAIAGHRTTYGAPFADVNLLARNDRITVTDTAGTRWRYDVVQKRIVDPERIEVVEDDPLGSGKPTLTLTTCHPRYSAEERLIVHAVLAAAQ